jgi:hypothetical protein
MGTAPMGRRCWGMWRHVGVRWGTCLDAGGVWVQWFTLAVVLPSQGVQDKNAKWKTQVGLARQVEGSCGTRACCVGCCPSCSASHSLPSSQVGLPSASHQVKPASHQGKSASHRVPTGLGLDGRPMGGDCCVYVLCVCCACCAREAVEAVKTGAVAPTCWPL